MIIEGVNHERNHCFIYEYGFHNPPMDPHAWTDLINAFVHYTYDISGRKSLISKLDCDERGKINSVIVYNKE